MRSLLREIESKFIEIEDSLDAPENETAVNEEELDEISTTGAVAGYNMPAAFAKPGKWQNKNKTYESRNTSKPAFDKTSIFDIMDAKYEKLIESYRAYSMGDGKTTPETKIKHTIKEVAKKLQEIEQTVNYASKLKTESGIARKGYGSSVESALNKISERLIKISERVRALGE